MNPSRGCPKWQPLFLREFRIQIVGLFAPSKNLLTFEIYENSDKKRKNLRQPKSEIKTRRHTGKAKYTVCKTIGTSVLDGTVFAPDLARSANA